MLSGSAAPADRVMSVAQSERLQSLQVAYLAIVDVLRGRRSRRRFLSEMGARSAIINRADRITGNAIATVVDRLMEGIQEGLSPRAIQHSIDQFVSLQVALPVARKTIAADSQRSPRNRRLIRTFLKVVEDLREDI